MKVYESEILDKDTQTRVSIRLQDLEYMQQSLSNKNKECERYYALVDEYTNKVIALRKTLEKRENALSRWKICFIAELVIGCVMYLLCGGIDMGITSLFIFTVLSISLILSLIWQMFGFPYD